MVNEHGVNVDDPGAQAQVVQALVYRKAHPAVFIALGGVIQFAAQQHAIGGIGKSGFRAVAPVQRQVHGLEHQVTEHVAAREERGGKDLHQQSHGGQGGRVLDDRRINQISDPAARQVVCHQPLFQGDLFRAGVFAEVDTQQRQALDGGPDGGLHSAQRGILPATDREDVRPLQIGCGVLEHLLQPAVGLCGAAGQVVGQLHFGGQGRHHRGHACPGIGGQQFLYHLQIAQRLFIGRGLAGTITAAQVEFGQLFAFCRVRDQGPALVQMVDDFDQLLIGHLVSGLAQHQPSDQQVYPGQLLAVDQVVCRLLYPVVLKPVVGIEIRILLLLCRQAVVVVQGQHGVLLQGRHQCLGGVRLGVIMDGCQGLQGKAVTNAGGQLQHLLRFCRQLTQAVEHELDDIIAGGLPGGLVQMPMPLSGAGVGPDCAPGVQLAQQFVAEKGIALGPVVQHIAQGAAALL